MTKKELMAQVAAMGISRLSRCNKQDLAKLYMASISDSLQRAGSDSNPQRQDTTTAALPDDSVLEDVALALFTDPAIVHHVQEEDTKQTQQNKLVLPAAVAEAFVQHIASVARYFGLLLGKNPGILKKNKRTQQTQPPAYPGLVHP